MPFPRRAGTALAGGVSRARSARRASSVHRARVGDSTALHRAGSHLTQACGAQRHTQDTLRRHKSCASCACVAGQTASAGVVDCDFGTRSHRPVTDREWPLELSFIGTRSSMSMVGRLVDYSCGSLVDYYLASTIVTRADPRRSVVFGFLQYDACRIAEHICSGGARRIGQTAYTVLLVRHGTSELPPLGWAVTPRARTSTSCILLRRTSRSPIGIAVRRRAHATLCARATPPAQHNIAHTSAPPETTVDRHRTAPKWTRPDLSPDLK